jgi:hypothetical protein
MKVDINDPEFLQSIRDACKQREETYLRNPLNREQAIAKLKVIRERVGWCLLQSIEGYDGQFLEINGRVEHRHPFEKRRRQINRLIAQLECEEIDEFQWEVLKYMIYEPGAKNDG